MGVFDEGNATGFGGQPAFGNQPAPGNGFSFGGQPAFGGQFGFVDAMPWWGAHDSVIDGGNAVALPPQWGAGGDFFLVFIPGRNRVAAWPREAHALRVSLISSEDLTRYDAETAAELVAERDTDIGSTVEDGRIEVTEAMAAELAGGSGLPAPVTVLGMEDHFEIWNKAAFLDYVESIDVAAMFAEDDKAGKRDGAGATDAVDAASADEADKADEAGKAGKAGE